MHFYWTNSDTVVSVQIHAALRFYEPIAEWSNERSFRMSSANGEMFIQFIALVTFVVHC